jgi:uncharacterized protein YchJ
MICRNEWSIGLIGVVFLILLFASCAISPSKATISPEEVLRSRVSAYWAARVNGSPEKAYELLDPDSRKTTSLASYSQRTSHSIILSYEIHDINVDLKKNEATVRVERRFRVRPGAIPINIPAAMEQTSDDLWVLVDGEWYMKYSPPGLNFMRLPTTQPENRKR